MGVWGVITNRALLIILITHCIENRVIRIDDAIIKIKALKFVIFLQVGFINET